MRIHLTIVVLLLILFSQPAAGQSWGLGIRLGDPSGISVKKYNKSHAWEFSLGRTHLFSNKRYYNDRYYNWYNGQNFGYKEHEFITYRSTVPIGLQIHYLIQKPLSDAGGLDWYFGFGGQLRTQRIEYDYRYKLENGPDWVYVNNEVVTEMDLGVDGVIGLEYLFPEAPIAIFLDATLFMELVNDPFVFNAQAGVGVRYTF